MNREFAKRLVIISNRLPFLIEKQRKKWKIIPGTGGLVTALAPVLKDRGGLWIGWVGIDSSEDLSDYIQSSAKTAGFSMLPVVLSKEEINLYYKGLSNEVIWPLFHDMPSLCRFEQKYWDAYVKVNSSFASVISKNTSQDDFIWVHDYHLICVASELRKLGVNSRVGFFLHIPFPSLDIFIKLPWRSEFLKALLDYDLLGFQTARDRKNFIQCLQMFVKDARVHGKGQVVFVNFEGREIRLGYFPISIDYREFNRIASSKHVADAAWFIHEHIPDRKIVLGVDRLDYSKGILNRFKAFSRLLEKYPEMMKKVTLFQIVVPSRRDIPEYEDLKKEIERLVGEINGKYTTSGWIPIHYTFSSLNQRDLLAKYRSSEIALVTPLKDGMNLVAKEYCASNIEKTGVLILSEFAGAAAQLHKGALLVNPYDIEEIADAIYAACKMPEREIRTRMTTMQKSIEKQDIYWWVNSYLQAAISSDLEDFPSIEDYDPNMKLF
ncbi:MAG: trehalose-6-phosphate synthase [Candidatus Krumholzibacteriota bacterium]|nr:trehalose-6-phosphate synthase [Candidatus Krumholzibacteriota bacterium]